MAWRKEKPPGSKRHCKINAIDMGDGTDKKDDWMKEITDFFQESILSKDKIKARKIRLKDAR